MSFFFEVTEATEAKDLALQGFEERKRLLLLWGFRVADEMIVKYTAALKFLKDQSNPLHVFVLTDLIFASTRIFEADDRRAKGELKDYTWDNHRIETEMRINLSDVETTVVAIRTHPNSFVVPLSRGLLY